MTKRKNRARNFLLLLCLIFVLSSCASRKGAQLLKFSSASLFGMVYDNENRPCPNAKIIIDGQKRTTSDINGRFIIQRLSRGEHEVTVKKEEYETKTFTFEFLNKSQVLYVSLDSFDQLVKKIEKALEDQKWEEGENLIQRAEDIKKKDPVIRYLKAVVLKQKGEPEEAVSTLLDVVKDGYRLPHIYLTLADLYQYSLDNPSEAVQYLEEYLKLKGDEEAGKRLDRLKDELKESMNGAEADQYEE